MDLDNISTINRSRSHRWHEGADPWSLADWSNALAGEVGELANFVKKIRRIETGAGGRPEESDRRDLTRKALDEVADVFLYLDLVANELLPGVSLEEVVASKFNRTSAEFGFPHRIPA